MLIKQVPKPISIWLILLAVWNFSGAASAEALKCQALFTPEKVVINAAGESVEELAARLQRSQNIVLTLEVGRTITTQFIPAAQGQPTFLFLPGVNRSRPSSAQDVQLLARMGSGVISFDLSTQPLSVIQLEEAIQPYFLDPKANISLPSLAIETQLVADFFKAQGVQNIIPVTLSYTGAIGPYLKGFATVIETAPMTSADAVNPEFAKKVENLRRLELFNPILGPVINRKLIDYGYRQNWQAQVERIVGHLNLSEARKKQMVEGYLTLSHAAEGFDWSQIEISDETHHAFILGDRESPALLRSQIETFLRLSRAGKKVSFFLVGGAGHIVPNDQPAAYAIILVNLLGRQNMAEQFGGAIFNPEKKEFKFMIREEAEHYAENILKFLDEQAQNAK